MGPVQPLQGMAFFSSWWGAWVSCFFINEGMGCVSSEASREVEKERVSGENDLKSSSSLPLHGQGRRGTVPFKTTLFWFFFFFF
jgi:hypothetical protein